MSGPSWRKPLFDVAAASRNCSRCNVPTFGISRSMMNFLSAIVYSVHLLIAGIYSLRCRRYRRKFAVLRPRLAVRARRLFLRLAAARQVTSHLRPLAHFGLELHPAMMQLDKAIDERETQACACARDRRALGGKALEGQWHHIGRDACARIGDEDAHVLAVDVAAQSHTPAARRVFEGVGDEVEDHLPQAPRIAHEGAHILAAVEDEVQSNLARPFLGVV